MVTKGTAGAILGIGLFLLLVAGILVGATGFMDMKTSDDQETIMTLGTVSVILLVLGLLTLAGGFAYIGVSANSDYLKLGAFIFAAVSLYLLVNVITSNMLTYGSILGRIGSLFGSMSGAAA